MARTRKAGVPAETRPLEMDFVESIRRFLVELQTGGGVLVENARDACLAPLVRGLLQDFPDLDVLGEATALGNAPEGATRIVIPRPDDVRWLDRNARWMAARHLRIVLWSDTQFVQSLGSGAPRLGDLLGLRIACPQAVPGFAVAGIRAATDSPGIEWRGGHLMEVLQVAFPGVRVAQVSAHASYHEILEDAHRNPQGWLAWTDVDGPFRLRQVRWALAETGRPKRNIIIEPEESSPGWWPLHALTIATDEAVRRLTTVGAARPGLIAALVGLEPEAIDLAEEIYEKGIPEEDVLVALGTGADGGATLAQVALDSGLVDVNEVVSRAASPPLLRALAENDSVQKMRRRCQDAVRRDLVKGEDLETEALGAWAASTKANLPVEILDHAVGPAQAWIVESFLRRGPEGTDTWRAVADAALRLGDSLVAVHWADCALATPTDDEVVQARALFTRARASFRQSEFVEAEEYARKCLELRERVLGAEHLDTAATLHIIGQALARQGKYIKALGAYTRAHAIEKKELGADHPDTAITLHAIGQVMSHLNRYHEALDAFGQALAIKESTLGPEHPSTASTHHAIGQVLTKQGKYDEALEAYRKDLSITERTLGPEHPSTANSLHGMGQALSLAGHHEEALVCFEREIPIIEKALGPAHIDLALTWDAIGQTQARVGRNTDSAHAYSRSLKVREKAQGADHLDVATTLYALAGVQAAAGNINPALETFRRALEIREKQLGKEHQLVAVTLHSIAQVLARYGRKKEAIDAFSRALAIKVATLGAEHPETAVTRFELGRALRDAGDPSGVAQMMGAASLLERVLGKDHPNVKAARRLLVQ